MSSVEGPTTQRSRDRAKRLLKEVRQSIFQTGLFFKWEALRNNFPKEHLDEDLVAAMDNAVLDSTLMHLRALDDFLSPAKRDDPDDIKAKDFGYSVDGSFLSKKARKEINKRHAHISWTRTDDFGGHTVHQHNIAAVKQMTLFFESTLANFLKPEDDEYESWAAVLTELKGAQAELFKKYKGLGET